MVIGRRASSMQPSRPATAAIGAPPSSRSVALHLRRVCGVQLTVVTADCNLTRRMSTACSERQDVLAFHAAAWLRCWLLAGCDKLGSA